MAGIRYEGEAWMPWIRPYVRSDGTPVRGHSRWAPGARREMTIFALVALAAVGLGNGNATAGGGQSPSPRSTVKYPIRFDTVPAPRVEPQPTVSYPIRFPSPKDVR
ncbi:hypothetical protein CTZ28_45270 [Streptomyces shenzhenensis]|uniref:Uncharacterized protein n=1 Tax=Streptomyces shenzhenensis TaxID=943815 RepID=A0A3M0I0A5_9ACTN|nr:hypothetical protein CTZ28_45270 [Streptomyces shenzhenensis]